MISTPNYVQIIQLGIIPIIIVPIFVGSCWKSKKYSKFLSYAFFGHQMNKLFVSKLIEIGAHRNDPKLLGIEAMHFN